VLAARHGICEPRDLGLEQALIRPRGARGGGLHEAPADLEIDRDVLPGLDALCEVTSPRPEAIDPRMHGVQVAAKP
jgi:hypothetical protein